MLTQTLRKLQRDGLITRTVTAAVPARVDYELTPLGETLLPVQRGVKAWAEGHIAEVHAARAHYDERDRTGREHQRSAPHRSSATGPDRRGGSPITADP